MKKPEHKTCHGCGLEWADRCIESGETEHLPSVDSLFPCSQCVRNPAIKDRWDERWTLDSDGTAFIEK